MKNNKTEILGLTAGFLTTIAFVPQALSIWLKIPAPATAISLPMYIVLNLGIILWVIYGIKVKAASIISANAVTLIFALSILIYKIIYG